MNLMKERRVQFHIGPSPSPEPNPEPDPDSGPPDPGSPGPLPRPPGPSPPFGCVLDWYEPLGRPLANMGREKCLVPMVQQRSLSPLALPPPCHEYNVQEEFEQCRLAGLDQSLSNLSVACNSENDPPSASTHNFVRSPAPSPSVDSISACNIVDGYCHECDKTEFFVAGRHGGYNCFTCGLKSVEIFVPVASPATSSSPAIDLDLGLDFPAPEESGSLQCASCFETILETGSLELPCIYMAPGGEGEAHKAQFNVCTKLLMNMLQVWGTMFGPISHIERERDELSIELREMFRQSGERLATQRNIDWMEYLFTTEELPKWIRTLEDLIEPTLPECNSEDGILSQLNWYNHKRTLCHRKPPPGTENQARYLGYFDFVASHHDTFGGPEFRHFSPLLVIQSAIKLQTLCEVPVLCKKRPAKDTHEEEPEAKRMSPEREIDSFYCSEPTGTVSLRGGHLHTLEMVQEDGEIEEIILTTTNRTENRGDGEVTRMGGGESYRPTARARSPPRADTFRASDRERRSPPISDSYHPGERRRSPAYRRDRTPPRDSGNWRARPRSPIRARSPPRRLSPRRVDDRRERVRSPPRRDERRRSRSPYDRGRAAPRARSPLPSRRSRSPPSGPRNAYRARSRSPRRDERDTTGPSSANWRRRSPSPAARDSERSSGSNSRRSSPHIHPSRLGTSSALAREVKAQSPPRSPPGALAYRERDSAKSTPKERSPIRQAPRSPPRGPAGFRAPTGPSSNRNFTAPAPSTPSANIPSVSAHTRAENSSSVAPPAGPRGYVPRGGGYSGRGGRGSFGADRGGRPDWGAAPSRPAVDTSRAPVTSTRPTPVQSPSPAVASAPPSSAPTGPSGGIPTGPRAASIPSRPSLQHSSSTYTGRSQSISSASGPRPHPAMAGLPQIIPNGRIDPTATGYTSEVSLRQKKREEEEAVLREDLKMKEEKLRKSLKTWDKLSRDSAGMALRSELSERHVRMLAGEGVGGAAF